MSLLQKKILFFNKSSKSSTYDSTLQEDVIVKIVEDTSSYFRVDGDSFFNSIIFEQRIQGGEQIDTPKKALLYHTYILTELDVFNTYHIVLISIDKQEKRNAFVFLDKTEALEKLNELCLKTFNKINSLVKA